MSVVIYEQPLRTRGGIHSWTFPFAWRSSQSLRDFLKAKGYIWQYILSQVLILTISFYQLFGQWLSYLSHLELVNILLREFSEIYPIDKNDILLWSGFFFCQKYLGVFGQKILYIALVTGLRGHMTRFWPFILTPPSS